MLYDASGRVVREVRATRQEETEAKVREKLKQIDSLLDVMWIEWAGRYALIVQWPQNGGPIQDKRWEMYQRGEIGACYDTLGWFCEDMHDASSLPVSVDSIENKVIELLKNCDNTVTPWRDRMTNMVEKNAKVRQSRQQQVTDRAQDIAEVLWHAAGTKKNSVVEKILREVASEHGS